MKRALLQYALVVAAFLFPLIGGCLALNRWRRHTCWGALALAILLVAVYWIARHQLVPYGAPDDRRDWLLCGDEPDYFLTALSLARDGDVDVANNIAAEDYRQFQSRPIGGGDWEFFNRISSGRLEARKDAWGDARFTQHRPGTCVFISPVFKAATSNYRWWAYFLFSALLAGYGAVCYLAAMRVGVRAGDAVLAICACLLAPPVFFYANQCYPEAACGVLVGTALLFLAVGGRPQHAAAPLLALAVWFSDRAVPAVGLVSLVLLWRLPRWRDRGVAVAILGVSALGFGAYCYHRFGVPWPVSHSEEYGFDYSRVLPRYLQILLDRKQGWFWLFPAALLLPVAAYGVIRRRELRWWGLLVTAMIVATLLFIAAFNDWQGGTNPRGRFYVIPQLYALPLLLVWLGGERRFAARMALAVMAAVSLAMLVWLLPNPHWWYRDYHPLFAWEGIQPWYFWLPDLSDGATAREWWKALAWLTVAATGLGACLYLPWRRVLRRAG